jgi:hypothetical protein
LALKLTVFFMETNNGVRADDGSLLLHAARSGTAKAVEELLLRNFDVEEADSFGSTPLTAALARQYLRPSTPGPVTSCQRTNTHTHTHTHQR